MVEVQDAGLPADADRLPLNDPLGLGIVSELPAWRISGSYLESCNCDAICPCRRIGGEAGGRSTYGVCQGALSWAIEQGYAGDEDLAGLAVVLACRYDDDEQQYAERSMAGNHHPRAPTGSG